MNKLLPFFFTTLVFVSSLSAQDVKINELVSTIKSFKDDRKLIDYLYRNDWVSKDSEDGITPVSFNLQQLRVDVFKKNLFGDSKNEYIIQLRDGRSFSVNIFYAQNEELLKVPGQITCFFNDGLEYSDQQFVFSFENIFKENEFCIVTNTAGNYIRTTHVTVELNRITKDKIHPFYSFESLSSTYSGVLTYDYHKSVKWQLQLEHNQYPKALVKNVSFRNELNYIEEPEREIEEGTYTEIVSFKNNLITPVKINEVTKRILFLNSFNDFETIDKCDSTITVYISEKFFQTYLLAESDMPEMTTITDFHDQETGYQCCHAFIQNRKLTTISKVGGKLLERSFRLKSPVSEILKPEFNPQKLYYIKYDGTDVFEGDLSYHKKDTLVKENSGYTFINFGNPSLVYKPFRYLDKDVKIEITDSKGTWINIPLRKLTPFLKPEFQTQFENCCKN